MNIFFALTHPLGGVWYEDGDQQRQNDARVTSDIDYIVEMLIASKTWMKISE